MNMIKVAYQGVAGAYSEKAINELAKKHNLNLMPASAATFEELFDTIIKEGLGFVPIENSIAGSVTPCYDLLDTHDVEIVGEFILPIHHCLLIPKGLDISEIKEVYSHPQALMQCSKFIKQNNLIPKAYEDTAGAAKFISKTQTKVAAIAGVHAAKTYDLNPYKENIENMQGNKTRFLLVKNKKSTYDFEKDLPKKDKTTVVFETLDIPAALYKCMGGFATNSVNLAKIESRPSQKEHFRYIFHVDFEGTIKDENVMLALKELEFFSKNMRVLGSYPKHKTD